MLQKKRTKTNDKLLSLTKEESDKIGVQVLDLVNHEMKYIVNKYVFQYKKCCFSTFGWTEDDLRQHINIILWKGVATFDLTKNIKITTYLSTILYYQMGNLSKSMQNKKHSLCKMFCVEDLYETDLMVDKTSTEDWSIYIQSFAVLMDKICKKEMKFLVAHLINGLSVTQMQKKFKTDKIEIIKIIKGIRAKMESCFGG